MHRGVSPVAMFIFSPKKSAVKTEFSLWARRWKVFFLKIYTYIYILLHFSTFIYIFYKSATETVLPLGETLKTFLFENILHFSTKQYSLFYFLLLESPCSLVGWSVTEKYCIVYSQCTYDAWVTQPERPKGAKDEVNRPFLVRSQGPEGP